MIFSEQWLREWVDPQMDTQQLIDQLTMAGLEVDACNSVASVFSGVVVGLVENVERHPDADKLSLCRVNDGKETHQVVCGAPNVRAGLKAPFALIGAQLHFNDEDKPVKIKKTKLRGIESNGMLCSAAELGMGDSADGLLELAQDAPVGSDIRSYLHLDDCSIELDLTPNRGDCLGLIGLAREVGVISRQAPDYPELPKVETASSDVFPVVITATKECPVYLGRVLRNIDPGATTPFWMQEKLRRCGLRSIDPVVDVTNFVLLELGQPMHAFDLTKLEGHIEVRLAKEHESLTLLDDREVKLSADTLVIADKDKAVAMAGIMGGLDSAVTDDTQDVFLECAFFAPMAIVGKARSYGMHTDASHRYERGVDYQLQHKAMERATQLLLEIVGGQAGPVVEATGVLPKPVQVELNFRTVERMLGIKIEDQEIAAILIGLGFELAEETASGLTVNVPSYRFDVSMEADLIEELARIYGYNNIPKAGGLVSQEFKTSSESQIGLSRYRHQLVALGYQEVVTYSFIDEKLSRTLFPTQDTVSLQNPISADMSVMRTSILPGLLTTLKYNENRQQDRLRLFETGMVFLKDKESGQIIQSVQIAGLVSGTRFPDNFNNNNEISDFYDVKGDVESLLALSREDAAFSFTPANQEGFHNGQCARVERRGEHLGYIGALHPSIQRELGITARVFMFELAVKQLQSTAVPRITELSRFPEVNRDLAIVVDSSVPAANILDLVRQNTGEYLTGLRLFDVYQGDAIEKNKKSIALGLTWQHPSRTLSDEEINITISSCVKALEDRFNANLRN